LWTGAGTFALEAGFQRNRSKVSPQQGFWSMRSIRWFAVTPFLALIVGPFFVNRAMRNVSPVSAASSTNYSMMTFL
jgi:hypothetical protein